jgi:protein-disulfide isomerase
MEPTQNATPSGRNDDQNPMLIPGAILIAGLMVAGAVVYTKPASGTPSPQVANVQQAAENLDNIKPVNSDDRILGDPNAPVKLVVFTDLECPFCKVFHATAQRVVDEYGKTGKVALVYRHFPLEQLHPKAPREAQAAECARELGGNEKFWAYIDKVFEVTPSNNGLEDSQLPQIADDIGLNSSQFSSCLNSGKHKDIVDAHYQDAVSTGGRGTPHSVVIAQNGKKFVIGGALPYEQVKATIEQALKEN